MKLVIFYHLKDWYTLSYPVLFNFLSIKKNKELLLENKIELVDFKDFLSNEDIKYLEYNNKNNIDIDYPKFAQKAVSKLVDVMRVDDLYDNSILLGFHPIGFDYLFYRKGHCQFDYYDIFKSKNCKFMIWMDDLHGFPTFPKISNYNEDNDYSLCSDYRLELVDKILTPSKNYYNLINSQYLNKTIQYFYSLNEDWYSEINIYNFKDRKNKILFSGAYSVYPIRKKIIDILKNYNPQIISEDANDPLTFSKIRMNETKENIKDYKKELKEFADIIGCIISPGYNRQTPNFLKKVGLNYLKAISSNKGAFFAYADKPCIFNLAKIIEILMCGSIGFFEFSPLLEKELGLIAYKHYVPITDEKGELIEDHNYYLKYLNTEEGEQIALTGANYVRENFSSKNRIKQLISILQSL